MAEKAMVVLLVEPGKRPVLEVLDGSVESMQAAVHGHLEHIMPFEDDVALVCNDEGKNYGMMLNRALYDSEGEMYDIIAGPFFVCYAPADSERLLSLPEDLVHKYAALFEAPERYYRGASGLILKQDGEAPEYLGVGYSLHPYKSGVDIEFTDEQGDTIEWRSIESDSEEYQDIPAAARRMAGEIALRVANEKCQLINNMRSLAERLDEAESEYESAQQDGVRVDILQLKQGEEQHLLRFAHLSWLENGTHSVEVKNYDHIYACSDEDCVDMNDEAAMMDLLERVYTRFNVSRPEDFRGHSLSVSDVVVLTKGNESKAFYCDWIGFQALPEKFCEDFLNGLKKENGHELA